MDNYFAKLNAINVNNKTEMKNGLTYLSWAWAWGEVKKLYPDTIYTIYENADGWNYHSDGNTAWVKTGVTVNGLEHIEYLPVMDYKNKSIPADAVTSFDVNKAIQRSLTKALARHGLGLYIYAGEDLPEDEKPDFSAMAQSTITKVQANAMATMIKNFGADQEKMLEAYKVASLDELNNEQYADIVRKLKAKYEKK
jgi:hypothetical protein